jgi:hypothetical protein
MTDGIRSKAPLVLAALAIVFLFLDVVLACARPIGPWKYVRMDANDASEAAHRTKCKPSLIDFPMPAHAESERIL